MYLASDVVFLDVVPQISDSGVGRIVCSKDLDSLLDTVICVNVFDGDDS